MATEWVNITASAYYADYNGYIRYANQVLNLTAGMTSSSPNGLRVFSISPDTHYRVTMVMQNRFRLACVETLTSGQTVTNYIFDTLDANDATNQGVSRTLEITSGSSEVYLCVGAWSSGAGDTLENTLATIVVEEEQEITVTQYTVTFADHDGSVLKTENVNEGGSATPPETPERTGYYFDCWNGSYTNVTADVTVSASYLAYITVTFKDYDNAVLKIDYVRYARSAVPPADPERAGYAFAGWDKAYAEIITSLTIKAAYTKLLYSVVFTDYDGTVIAAQSAYIDTTIYTPLMLEYPEDRIGYHFIGWLPAPVNGVYTGITENLIIIAQYELLPVYTVTFADWDGTVFKTVQVTQGAYAVQPEAPRRNGYVFDYWSPTQTGTQEDMTITAVYRAPVGLFKVYFYSYDWQTILKEEWVVEGGSATAPEPPEYAGHTFSHWSADYTYISYAPTKVYPIYTTNEYTVTFLDHDGTTLKTGTVEYGDDAVPPEAPVRSGYSFTGWDGDYTNITGELTLIAQYSLLTHTVTFVDYDGTLLKTETVPDGESATPPKAPARAGYDFIGWDGDYSNVTSDLTLSAQYDDAVFTVTFLDYDGTTLKTETVGYLESAMPPTEPVRAGYAFTGWEGSYTLVSADATITAQYRLLYVFTVRFLSYTGQVISTQRITEGCAASPPPAPVRPGYTLTGWSESVTSILSDMDVMAVYAKNAAPLLLQVFSGDNLLLTIPKVTAATLRDALDGELTLSFSTLSHLAAGIQTEQVLRLGNLYFSVARVQKSITNGLWLTSVTGEHISYTLNDDAYMLTSFDFTGTPSGALSALLAGTRLSAGTVEFSDTVTLQINQECTRRAALMQLIALLGGEIEYDGYAVNIRAHRGSQTPRELMESRNVTNVGVTVDARSNTVSYEIAFFKLVDIAVGDMAHIVFSPLGIDVNTRIISLEYNPFHPYNARVEIGSYIPSINDSLYRLEKQLSENLGEQISGLQTELETMGTELETAQSELSSLQETVDGMVSAREVSDLSVGESSFLVSFTDGTHSHYNYNMDVGGHIISITKVSE